MTRTLESTDVKNRLEDLSGLVIQPGENPYEALINVCKGYPVSQAASLGTPVDLKWRLSSPRGMSLCRSNQCD